MLSIVIAFGTIRSGEILENKTEFELSTCYHFLPTSLHTLYLTLSLVSPIYNVGNTKPSPIYYCIRTINTGATVADVFLGDLVQ